jgi:hypothetical protein
MSQRWSSRPLRHKPMEIRVLYAYGCLLCSICLAFQHERPPAHAYALRVMSVRSEGGSASAPRVNPQANVPVRRQIQWAKAKIKMEKAMSMPPKVKQSFRKYIRCRLSFCTPLYSWCAVVTQCSRIARRRKEYVPCGEDVEGTDVLTARPTTMFVDGYNIIG